MSVLELPQVAVDPYKLLREADQQCTWVELPFNKVGLAVEEIHLVLHLQ